MKKILTLAFMILSMNLFAQNFQWAKSFGNADYDYPYSIAADNSGNVIMSGIFGGTIDFDPSAGTYNLTSFGAHDLFISKYSPTGSLVFAFNIGATNSTSYNIANYVTTDSAGNIFVTGGYYGNVDFDPGSGVFSLDSAASGHGFFAKYSPSGNLIWAKAFLGTGSGSGSTMVLDPMENIYMSGSFSGTIDFDLGPGVSNFTTNGFSSAFIAKYTSDGDLLFVKILDANATFDKISIFKIDLDVEGNILATGQFRGFVDMDPSAVSILFSSTPSDLDMFLAKYDSDGNYLWAKKFASPSVDNGHDVATDPSGNIYFIGYFQTGSIDFDTGPGVSTLSAPGIIIGFFAKYTPSGDFIWAYQLGGGGGCTHIEGLLVEKNTGNVYLAGDYNSSVDFDLGPGNYWLPSDGLRDVFLAKYDSTGGFIYAKHFGGSDPEIEQGSFVVKSPQQDIFVAGYFVDTVDFDPEIGIYNLISEGDRDIFIVKLSECTSVPSQPSIINGNDTVSPSDTVVYSISLIPEAFSYTWTLPSGWIGTSSTNSISVIVGTTDGIVSVSANNSCGPSTPQELKIELIGLGISDKISNVTFDVSPNPSSGIVKMVSSEVINSIEIKNIQGQTIYSESDIEKFKSEINLSKQAAGIYFLNAKTKNHVLSKKIMIHK